MILCAEKTVVGGQCRQGIGILIDSDGRIASIGPIGELESTGEPVERLPGKVLFPGMINAHSHAFQRLLRGRTQVAGPAQDNFWTWRRRMYQVAASLDPEGVRVVARQMFLEMLLSGVTTVGEFHYLHHQPDGTPYDDPSALALAVIEAARDVGIRISLLRTVYLRGDFGVAPAVNQRRFCDGSVEEAAARIDHLCEQVSRLGDERVTVGVASHSVRAMARKDIISLKTVYGDRPFHIHVSEQPREVESCREAYGMSPVELLAQSGVLDSLTCLVHGTHLEDGEVDRIAQFGSTVCVCPSTEADLGDGLVNASRLYKRGVHLALGTDGQTLGSILEEARRLEMHERLRTESRNVLIRREGDSSGTAVLEAGTINGARALNLSAGELAPGRWGDVVTFDLSDPHLLGLDDGALPDGVMFSADSRALADVMVAGRWVVRDGVHEGMERSRQEYGALASHLFN